MMQSVLIVQLDALGVDSGCRRVRKTGNVYARKLVRVRGIRPVLYDVKMRT